MVAIIWLLNKKLRQIKAFQHFILSFHSNGIVQWFILAKGPGAAGQYFQLHFPGEEESGLGQDQPYKLKSLATEREANLFGPGFPEKASKKLELNKTIAKASQSSGSQAAKRARFSKDSSDLRSFLAKGASTWYGGGKFQCQQPYQAPHRFQSKRYFQQSRTSSSQDKKKPSSKASQN